MKTSTDNFKHLQNLVKFLFDLVELPALINVAGDCNRQSKVQMRHQLALFKTNV